MSAGRARDASIGRMHAAAPRGRCSMPPHSGRCARRPAARCSPSSRSRSASRSASRSISSIASRRTRCSAPRARSSAWRISRCRRRAPASTSRCTRGIARVPGVAVASPVVEVQARLPGRDRTLKLVGIDPFRAAQMQPALAAAGASAAQGGGLLAENSVWLSPAAAQSLGPRGRRRPRRAGGARPVTLHVAGLLPPGEYRQPLGMLDIATAQWRLRPARQARSRRPAARAGRGSAGRSRRASARCCRPACGSRRRARRATTPCA